VCLEGLIHTVTVCLEVCHLVVLLLNTPLELLKLSQEGVDMLAHLLVLHFKVRDLYVLSLCVCLARGNGSTEPADFLAHLVVCLLEQGYSLDAPVFDRTGTNTLMPRQSPFYAL
jgi:hypothetical protein